MLNYQRGKRTLVTLAAIMALAPNVASAADLKANALKLLGTKCAQVAGKGCHASQLTNAGAWKAVFAPPMYGPGSRSYMGKFAGWAQFLAPASGWYTCKITVRNVSVASGVVTCGKPS